MHTPGVRTYSDGREVCDITAAGRRAYVRRTGEMADRQNSLCAICRRFMVRPTFDHQGGRGHGGSKRDDRIEIDGHWHNAALCYKDNHQKGSRTYEWRDGLYLPIGATK